MTVISIGIQKGGVGKTTSTAALAEALSLKGYRVLVIDLDPQSSLSEIYRVDTDGRGIGQVLEGELELRDILVKTDTGFFLAPTDISLAETEVSLSGRMESQYILKDVLEQLSGADFVLIDCPPSLGTLTINALVASDYVLIPVEPAILEMRGLRLFLATIERIQKRLNPELKIAGILATKMKSRVVHHRQGIERLKSANLPLLEGIEIASSISVAEAAAAPMSIVSYRPDSPQAQAYTALAEYLETLR